MALYILSAWPYNESVKLERRDHEGHRKDSVQRCKGLRGNGRRIGSPLLPDRREWHREMWFIKRKCPASAVAAELARIALQLNEDHRAAIGEVAHELSVPVDKVEKEFRHFLVYMVETVVQTVSDECEAGDCLTSTYRKTVSDLALAQGYGVDFWQEQEKRTPIYDAAWQDSRVVNPGVAVSSALASQIRTEDDIGSVSLLSLYGTNLLAPLTQYLRGIRIVGPF
jgi:hypothetical protein